MCIYKKKTLLFLGAGANNQWVGATTKSITHKLIESDCFYCLIKEYLSDEIGRPVNFEDIISTIDNLFLFYRGNQPPIDSEIPLIFDVKKGIDEYIKHNSIGNEVEFVAVKFYKAINIIVKQIRDYAIVIDEKKESNDLLAGFLKSISKNNIIRAYTTNYDRLPIDACKYSTKGKSITFNDGFSVRTDLKPSSSENIDDSKRLKGFNLKEVLHNKDSNCYYNLHGSIYWDWIHEKEQFLLSDDPIDLELHSGDLMKDSIQKGNPNEPFLISPIITGYKKTQRLSLPPFNAYYNAFFYDCMECDTWYIIGYSFSDIHLNNLMKTAISHRREIPKIIYIDKQDVNSLKNGYNLNANFQDIFNGQVYKIFDKYKYIDDYLFCSNDNKIFLYFDGFETFLRNNVWHSIL